jgi:hypothetical protein
MGSSDSFDDSTTIDTSVAATPVGRQKITECRWDPADITALLNFLREDFTRCKGHYMLKNAFFKFSEEYEPVGRPRYSVAQVKNMYNKKKKKAIAALTGSSGASLTPLSHEDIWKVLLAVELKSITKIRQPGEAPLSLKRSRSQLSSKRASPKKPAPSNKAAVGNAITIELQRQVNDLQKTVENLQMTLAAMQEKGQKSESKFEELAVSNNQFLQQLMLSFINNKHA